MHQRSLTNQYSSTLSGIRGSVSASFRSRSRLRRCVTAPLLSIVGPRGRTCYVPTHCGNGASCCCCSVTFPSRATYIHRLLDETTTDAATSSPLRRVPPARPSAADGRTTLVARPSCSPTWRRGLGLRHVINRNRGHGRNVQRRRAGPSGIFHVSPRSQTVQ